MDSSATPGAIECTAGSSTHWDVASSSVKRTALRVATSASSASHSAAGDSHTSAHGDSAPAPKPGSMAVGPTLNGPAQPASPGPETPTSAPPGETDTARPSVAPALPNEFATTLPEPMVPYANVRKPLKLREWPTQKNEAPLIVHMRPP
jgi:hypothetical protein